MKQFVFGFGQFVNEMLEPTCECGGIINEDGICKTCGQAEVEETTEPVPMEDGEFPDITAEKDPNDLNNVSLTDDTVFEKKDKSTEKAKPGERSKTFPFAKIKGKEEKEPAKPGKKLSKSEQARKNFGLDKKK